MNLRFTHKFRTRHWSAQTVMLHEWYEIKRDTFLFGRHQLSVD